MQLPLTLQAIIFGTEFFLFLYTVFHLGKASYILFHLLKNRINQKLKMDRIRKYNRSACYIPTQLIDAQSKDTFGCIIKDIGQRGVKIVSNYNLRLNQKIFLNIPIPKKPIMALGEVVHISESHYGILFHNFNGA